MDRPIAIGRQPNAGVHLVCGREHLDNINPANAAGSRRQSAFSGTVTIAGSVVGVLAWMADDARQNAGLVAMYDHSCTKIVALKAGFDTSGKAPPYATSRSSKLASIRAKNTGLYPTSSLNDGFLSMNKRNRNCSGIKPDEH